MEVRKNNSGNVVGQAGPALRDRFGCSLFEDPVLTMLQGEGARVFFFVVL
jgi:hypothetical protein